MDQQYAMSSETAKTLDMIRWTPTNGVADTYGNKALDFIDALPIDHGCIPQGQLDIIERERRSLFPWRGQFSPQLIEAFLDTFAARDDVIFDPFAGSGTVLFEGLRKGLAAYGTEVNPAAVIMTKTARFSSLARTTREDYILDVQARVNDIVPTTFHCNWQPSLRQLISEVNSDEYTYIITANAVLQSYDAMEQRWTQWFGQVMALNLREYSRC